LDLSGLPHYVPRQQLTGTLRIWGNNYIRDGYTWAKYWEQAFQKFQPGLRSSIICPRPASRFRALLRRGGPRDDRKAIIMDLLTFEQVYHHPSPRFPR